MIARHDDAPPGKRSWFAAEAAAGLSSGGHPWALAVVPRGKEGVAEIRLRVEARDIGLGWGGTTCALSGPVFGVEQGLSRTSDGMTDGLEFRQAVTALGPWKAWH
jgi:hypothetical protein